LSSLPSLISFKTKKGKKDSPNLEGSISDSISISSSIKAALKKKALGSSTKNKLVDSQSTSSKTATTVKSFDASIHSEGGRTCIEELDEEEEEEEDMKIKELVRAMESSNYPQGEIRQARAGLMSRNSFRKYSLVFKPPQNQVSFLEEEDDHGDITKDETEKPRHAVENNEATIASNKTIVSQDDKYVPLILSNKELLQKPNRNLDVFAEGQYFLGISVLVYMYAHLRENCRMGHTRCSMHDVDTNSIQSQYNKAGEDTRYLDAAKTIGSIIRLVVDEMECSNDDDDADHEIVGGESREYEREQAEAFRKWINDSRISQLDEQTEQMLLKMRRDVARHRWRRAISAIRLSEIGLVGGGHSSGKILQW